ncbi:hypothetical protein LOAG_08805 [Loa loa]|uniref:Uncharacterized protein n=1 Tax=Loa loa TaxID=7209 RepID=A0A1S0TTQ7_LOALO|nr:hypothetical protein LOAG_08805 [Loa loa]EFO19685.1 hypothetical protein LOAG_08805 [Loa loa]
MPTSCLVPCPVIQIRNGNGRKREMVDEEKRSNNGVLKMAVKIAGSQYCRLSLSISQRWQRKDVMYIYRYADMHSTDMLHSCFSFYPWPSLSFICSVFHQFHQQNGMTEEWSKST